MSAELLIVPLWPKFQFLTRTKSVPPTGNAGGGPCAGVILVPPPMVSGPVPEPPPPPPLDTVRANDPASASLVNVTSPGGEFQACAVRVIAPSANRVVSRLHVADVWSAATVQRVAIVPLLKTSTLTSDVPLRRSSWLVPSMGVPGA